MVAHTRERVQPQEPPRPALLARFRACLGGHVRGGPHVSTCVWGVCGGRQANLKERDAAMISKEKAVADTLQDLSERTAALKAREQDMSKVCSLARAQDVTVIVHMSISRILVDECHYH